MFACVGGTHTLWRVLGSHVRSLSAHLLHFSEQAVHGEGRAGAIGSSKTERETERKTAEGEDRQLRGTQREHNGHTNHRLTGRAGYDLIMAGTHSHKECTCHQQTIACFGTDGRPPHTIKWHHLSCLVQQRTSTCWKTVLNLPKVNRRGTDLLKHLCEPLGSATAVATSKIVTRKHS